MAAETLRQGHFRLELVLDFKEQVKNNLSR